MNVIWLSFSRAEDGGMDAMCSVVCVCGAVSCFLRTLSVLGIGIRAAVVQRYRLELNDSSGRTLVKNKVPEV